MTAYPIRPPIGLPELSELGPPDVRAEANPESPIVPEKEAISDEVRRVCEWAYIDMGAMPEDQ